MLDLFITHSLTTFRPYFNSWLLHNGFLSCPLETSSNTTIFNLTCLYINSLTIDSFYASVDGLLMVLPSSWSALTDLPGHSLSHTCIKYCQTITFLLLKLNGRTLCPFHVTPNAFLSASQADLYSLICSIWPIKEVKFLLLLLHQPGHLMHHWAVTSRNIYLYSLRSSAIYGQQKQVNRCLEN